ncbi:TPA: Gfo/Idh/MocA family oxidoreductase [Candidatus Bathyarchaeota archaeon]|nr:Gfo/Idh/MocA family oxidoreductase [Candidatus Bathyarchaeota archaeon]
MRKVRVAVIGSGFVARNFHLPALERMPEAEVAAVVDARPERARGAAERFGIKRWFTDHADALELEDVDVALVCTPTYTHREIVLCACAHGKHVLCEKPVALRLRDVDEMTDEARRAGVKFMVGHCLRFWPEYVRVRQLIDDGEIGEPVMARAYRQSSWPVWGLEGWYEDIRKSGGVAVDLSIHDVDFLRWVFGDVERVYAQGGCLIRRDVTAHDYVQALLRFGGGEIAYVEGSWAMPEGYPFSTYLEVAGTQGLITVDNQTTAALRIYAKGRREALTPVSEDAYFLELRHFIDCVVNDREPAVPGGEARKSLEISLAVLKSVKEGRPVSLPLKEEVL